MDTIERYEEAEEMIAELLTALKLAVATIERLTVNHGGFSSTQGTLDVARAAIAQAEEDR